MASPQPTAIIGRRAPATTTPDWVYLSDVSQGAKETYRTLKMFAETFAGTGSDEPFPAQALVGKLIKRSQGAVSGYVQELRVLGAVDSVPRAEAGGKLQYRVHETAPDGYTGPLSLLDWLARDAAANANATEGNVGPAAAANVAATNAANVGHRGADERRANVAAANATNAAPANGATLAATQTATAADEHPHLAALGRLLSAAEALGMDAEDASFHRKLTGRLLPMLEDGWREDELRKLITEDLGGADKKLYVALAHLRDAADRQTRLANRPAPRQGGPRCDKGLGHEIYPADRCQECAINTRDEAARAEREAARQLAAVQAG